MYDKTIETIEYKWGEGTQKRGRRVSLCERNGAKWLFASGGMVFGAQHYQVDNVAKFFLFLKEIPPFSNLSGASFSDVVIDGAHVSGLTNFEAIKVAFGE